MDFKYQGSYSRDYGEITFVYKKGGTKLQATSRSKTPSGIPFYYYSVTIFSPSQPLIVSQEKAKPKGCSDEDAYKLGEKYAQSQRNLIADCDYLFDMAQAQEGEINHDCFCKGVVAWRMKNEK